MQIQAPLYENKVVDFVLSKVKLKNNELDLDSFIKIYNGLNNPVEKTKSKAVKKKTVKKETKKTTLKKKKTTKVKK